MDVPVLPKAVVVTDVVTRDGFQDEPNVVPTEGKVRIIEGLIGAGVRSIEVTSFVHSKLVPQMADASDVMERVPRDKGVAYSALVPNLKGAERAVAAQVDEIRVVISASESHNRANLNRSVPESIEQLREVGAFVGTANPRPKLAAGLATSFACPFEGRIPIAQLLSVVEGLVDIGVTMINLADTTGMANPVQVSTALDAVKQRFPELELGLHLHDTRGMGLANALAGLEQGIDRFDSSLGGIGGCPFAPGATGNISTEDLVHMLHEMGIETGIDLDQLLGLGDPLSSTVGHDLNSRVQKAGPSTKLHQLRDAKVASSSRQS